MKTLITAIALTAILATSAVAKTERTRPAHIHPNKDSANYNRIAICGRVTE
jgi:hypothetical protein